MKRILNHFRWSKWVIVGEQVDTYSLRKYLVLRKENDNGLFRYKKVLIVGSSFYYADLKIN